MKYQVTKTYGHEQGLSCVFRQHRANTSHCQVLHGYALAIGLTFEAETLDDRNWVQDFGGLKVVKKFLQDTFDHKLVIAADDPELDVLTSLGGMGLADPIVLPAVGCEAFADYIFGWIDNWLYAEQAEHTPFAPAQRVKLIKVTVAEHNGNQAAVVA